MKRKAFTLIELLVVIGIIALLAGILLPVVNRMRKSAQITGEKADFQTITTALNAYKSDFGDYPRNANLPKWNMLQTGGPTTPLYAPVYQSLASALLGPGPAVTQMVGTNLENGDGSDGPGFRGQTTGAIPGTTNATAGSTTVTMTVAGSYIAQSSALLSNFVSSAATPTSITFFPTIASPYQETAGISAVTGTAALLQLTLMSGPSATHNNVTCLISQAGGKVWGPYISADTFKVAYIPQKDQSGNLLGGIGAKNAFGGWGQPVILDRWGQVIQYFPTYGTVSNRASDSVSFKGASNTVIAAISAGPLYGYSQAWSLENKSGTSFAQNAIWDFRDGAPFFSASSLTIPSQAWSDPAVTPDPNNFYPQYAIQWMLGADQPDPANNNAPSNVITGSEKLQYDGPFILISAGPNVSFPDGPGGTSNSLGGLNLGGFCNLVDHTGKPLPAGLWQKAVLDSGNIYNFDRQ